MQKINKFLFVVLMAFSPLSSFSEELAGNIESVDSDMVNTEDDSFDQEEFLDYISENIEFEKMKNKLQNQLELEKIKNAISKLKSDSKGEEFDININDSASFPEKNIDYQLTSTVNSESKKVVPKLILASDVGGVNAFGVSVDGKVKFVKLNSEFKDSFGNKYRVKKQKNKYIVSGE